MAISFPFYPRPPFETLEIRSWYNMLVVVVLPGTLVVEAGLVRVNSCSTLLETLEGRSSLSSGDGATAAVGTEGLRL